MRAAPLVDHHQHLFSPRMAELISRPEAQIPAITARDLIGFLDGSGIDRGVVLSTAYIWSQPGRRIADEERRVAEENDWTAEQVAAFPDRLVGFCSVNPLRDHALAEIARCARDPRSATGLKLHIANSAVDYHDAEHVAKVRRVFSAANERGMAIVVHMRTSMELGIPYGPDEARVFLDRLLPAAPDVPVQVAHLCGTGAYGLDEPVDPALSVFIGAIASGDRRTAKLLFDVTQAAFRGATPAQAELLARRIRELGVERVLFGGDAALPGRRPVDNWAAFRALPLTEAELQVIAGNVAPYLRRPRGAQGLSGPSASSDLAALEAPHRER